MLECEIYKQTIKKKGGDYENSNNNEISNRK